MNFHLNKFIAQGFFK